MSEMTVFNNHIKTMKKELTALKMKNLGDVFKLFRTHERVVFCTMGKSAFACAKVVYTARSYGLSWYELDVCHAFHGDAGIIKEGDLLVLVSKSGETEETAKVAEYFKLHRKIAITSEPGGSLCKLCDYLLVIPCSKEGSPFGYAPMISTTLYMIVLHGILCDVIEYRGVKIEDYARNHPAGAIGQALELDENLSPANSF